MSVRAELVRLGLRWLLKPSNHPGVTIIRRREKIGNFQRWVPMPPADTEIRRDKLGGVAVVRVATPRSQADRHVLYLHGGGYVTGEPELYRHILWRFASAAAARLVAIKYRLAPEHPFPAALDDAVAAWRGLLAEGADPMENPEDVPYLAARYLAGADPRHPYASPLYGDPTGLPPSLIQVGSDEILRDDSVRMAARMRAAGVDVALEIWPRMPHVWHTFASVMPEARRAIARLGAFVREQTA